MIKVKAQYKDIRFGGIIDGRVVNKRLGELTTKEAAAVAEMNGMEKYFESEPAKAPEAEKK